MGFRDEAILVAPAPAQPQASTFRNRAIPVGQRPAAAPALTPEQIAQMTHAAPQEPRPFDPLGNLQRGAQLTAQAAGRGAANVAGFPGDMIQLAKAAGGDANQLLRLAFGDGIFDAAADTAVGRFLNAGGPPVIPTSDILKEAAGSDLRSLGVPIISDEEQTPGERIQGSAVELGLEALTGGGLLARSAARGGPAAATLAPNLGEALAKGQAGKVLAGDVGAAAGAGSTMQAGQENGIPQAAGEFAGPLGEMMMNLLLGGAGGLTGGLGTRGLLNAGEVAGRKTGVLPTPPGPRRPPIDPKTGDPFGSAIQEAANVHAQRNASNPARAANNIADFEAGINEGPLVRSNERPTASMMAGDEGLAMLEAQLRGQGDADIGRRFIERDNLRTTRARELLDETAPPGDGRGVTDEFNRRAKARTGEAAAARTAAEREAEAFEAGRRAAAEELTANAPAKDAAARTIDETVVNTLTAAQARKNAAAEAIDPAGDVTRDAGFLQDAADAEVSARGALSDPGNVPQGLIKRIRDLAEVDPETGDVVGPGSVTVKDLQRLRPEISSEVAKARKAGDFALADSLKRIQKAINDDIETLAAEGGEAGQRAQQFLRLYSEEFAPIFNRGPGDEATKFRKDFNLDRQQRTTTPPSKTADRFLRPASPEKAASLRRIIETAPNREAGAAATRQFLLADLAQSGVVDSDGGISRVKLGAWRKRWGDETLDRAAPGFVDEIDALTTRAGRDAEKAAALKGEVEAAIKNEKLTEREIKLGALGFALDAKGRGVDPVTMVKNVMRDGDSQRAMKEVVAEIGGDKAAMDGLKQSVRDFMIETAVKTADDLVEGGPVSNASIDKLLTRHGKTLAEVFSPDEMNALRQVNRLIRNERLPKNIKALTGSPTAERNARRDELQRTAEVGLKAWFGMLRGGGMSRAIRLGLEAWDGDMNGKLRRLETQMMLDPELARHMLRADTRTDPDKWTKEFQRILRTSAALQRTDDEE